MMARLTLRGLAAHRARLVFTAVAVILGVAFVSGTMIFRDTATASFDAVFADAEGQQEVTVSPTQVFTGEDVPRPLVPASLLTDLRRGVPGAEAFLGATDGYAAIIRSDGEIVGGATTAHFGRAYQQRPGSRSQLRITKGRAPEAAEDVVVESRTAIDGRLAVGDEVTIVTPNAEQPMRIVGVFTLGEDRIGEAATYVGFTPAVAEQLLTAPGKYSAIWAIPKQGVTSEQLAQQISQVVPSGYDVKTSAENAQDTKEEINGIFTILGRLLLAFAGVSVVVGSFIIFNTFAMLVEQRVREFALLRALGASRKQVTRAVLGEAVGIGLLGSTIGIGVGIGVSVLLGLVFERFGTQLPSHPPVLAGETLFWSYLVGIVVTVLAAYLPARRGARIPPIAALRADPPSRPARSLRLRLIIGSGLVVIATICLVSGLSAEGENASSLLAIGGASLFAGTIVLIPLLSSPVLRVFGWPLTRFGGATGHLSLGNAQRNPRRTAATASALIVGLALVSLASVVAASVSSSVDARLDRQFGAEYSLEPRGLLGFGPDVVTAVAAVPGVRSVTAVKFGTVKVGDAEIPVTVADPAGLTQPASLKLTAGEADLGRDELLVQQSAADERGWRVGRTLAGTYPDGARAQFRVSGIFADNEVLNRPVIMSPVGYEPHSSSPLVQKAFVDLEDTEASAVAREVRSVLRNHPAAQLSDRADAQAAAREGVDQVLSLILVLLLLSVVIAAIGIVNTLSLSVVERTREIGLLRAIGMGRAQVRSMIRYESLVITLFGAALGMTLGTLLGVATQRTLSAEGMEILDVPFGRLALYLVGAVGIGVIAAIWPAWRAARMKVLDAIRTE